MASEFTITLEDVQKFITDKKDDPDVIQFVTSISIDKPLNPDIVSAYLQTTEGKNLIQPLMDQRVTEAIKTHDEKNKAKIDAGIKAGIAAEMLRLNPQESPEQKQIRELRAEQEKYKQEWENDKKNGQIKELAFQIGIDPVFISGINFGSVEEANLYMQKFKAKESEIGIAKVNELMAQGYKPGGSAPKPDNKKVDLSKLSQAELMKMEMSGELDAVIGN
jgi:hypothetical protein